MAGPIAQKLPYGTMLGLYTVDTFSVANPSPDINTSYPDVGGGWLWNFENLGTRQAAAYANAVATGLGLVPKQT